MANYFYFVVFNSAGEDILDVSAEVLYAYDNYSLPFVTDYSDAAEKSTSYYSTISLYYLDDFGNYFDYTGMNIYTYTHIGVIGDYTIMERYRNRFRIWISPHNKGRNHRSK